MTDFTRDGITAHAPDAAVDVPMLDMYGGENWTPNENHPGLFKRAGIDRWVTYKWDPDAKGEFDGNYVPGQGSQLRRSALRLADRRPRPVLIDHIANLVDQHARSRPHGP